MKYRFKVLSVVLSVTMILCFCACGTNSVSTSAFTETSSEVSSDSEDEIAKSEIIPLIKTANYRGYSASDDIYISVNYEEFSIDDSYIDGYTQLSDALGKKSESDKVENDKAFTDIDVSTIYTGGEHMNLYQTTTSNIVRSDNRILSILDYAEGYYGGAHGSHLYETYNYDSKSGKEIVLTDIVSDTDALLKILDERFLEKYSESYFYTPSEYRSNNPDEQIKFAIGYTGITFYYDEYALNCYAAGPFICYLSFEELEGIVDDSLSTIPSSWMNVYGGSLNPTAIDYNVDGELDTIQITSSYEDYGTTTYSLYGKNIDFNDYYSFENHIVCVDSNYYLYVFANGDNDYVDLKIIDLSDFSLVEHNYGFSDYSFESTTSEDSQGYSSNKTYALCDPNSLVLATRFNVLSTYEAYKTYMVGTDGLPSSTDKLFTTDTEKVLETTCEISFKKIDSTGNIIDTVKLPAGTLLAFVSLDGESFVNFVVVDEADTLSQDVGIIYRTLKDVSVKDGKDIYRLSYTNDGMLGFTIGGKSSEDVFEAMYYAG